MSLLSILNMEDLDYFRVVHTAVEFCGLLALFNMLNVSGYRV